MSLALPFKGALISSETVFQIICSAGGGVAIDARSFGTDSLVIRGGP
jgi:hypothetical protein